MKKAILGGMFFLFSLLIVPSVFASSTTWYPINNSNVCNSSTCSPLTQYSGYYVYQGRGFTHAYEYRTIHGSSNLIGEGIVFYDGSVPNPSLQIVNGGANVGKLQPNITGLNSSQYLMLFQPDTGSGAGNWSIVLGNSPIDSSYSISDAVIPINGINVGNSIIIPASNYAGKYGLGVVTAAETIYNGSTGVVNNLFTYLLGNDFGAILIRAIGNIALVVVIILGFNLFLRLSAKFVTTDPVMKRAKEVSAENASIMSNLK